MTEELEPITLNFPTLNKSIDLSPRVVEWIWSAVKRGDASNPQEYVDRVFSEYFAKLRNEVQTSTPETSSGTNTNVGENLLDSSPSGWDDSSLRICDDSNSIFWPGCPLLSGSCKC